MGRGPPMRRRGSPPQGRRMEDRRFLRDRRRGRSPSPYDHYRRTPPPYKRFRNDEEPPFREDDRFAMRPPEDHFDRRGPPPFRDRYLGDLVPRGREAYPRPPSPPRKREAMTYKEFVYRELGDDVTPEEAKRAYDQYLTEFWGSQIRAQFEARRNEAWMRKKYDPREFQKALDRRNDAAKSAAKEFFDGLQGGRIDSKGSTFNQGEPPEGSTIEDADGNQGEKSGALPPPPSKGEPKFAPDICWKPDRVAGDLALSMLLIPKLDGEKGITDNPLISEPAAENAATAEQPKPEQEKEGVDIDIKSEDGVQNGKVPEAEEKDFDSLVAKLDMFLVYLWRVHGVDYYGGEELSDPSDYEGHTNLRRTIRGPRPEEGEQATDEEEKKGVAIVEKKIEGFWKHRLTISDPFEAKLQKERVANFIDDFIESQITLIDDSKWGSKLSQKLFVGKEYVVKHIRLKHTHVIDAEREKLYEELYWENFKREKEAQEEERRKVEEAAQEAQWGGAAGGPWTGPMAALPGPQGFEPGYPEGGPGHEVVLSPWTGDEGYEDFDVGVPRGGRGFGPGGFGGRGGPMGPMGPVPLGRIASGGPMMEGPMVGPPLGGPAPGLMLVPAPGAGPLGPFIQVPIPEGGPPMGAPMMRGRGGRGIRPPGPLPGRMGPPIFLGGPPPIPPVMERRMSRYYDLDAPQNNRSVLDYGDL